MKYKYFDFKYFRLKQKINYSLRLTSRNSAIYYIGQRKPEYSKLASYLKKNYYLIGKWNFNFDMNLLLYRYSTKPVFEVCTHFLFKYTQYYHEYVKTTSND